MKMKEILIKETDHIRHELAEQQKHLFTLRAQSVTEKLEDPTQIGKARRNIARFKTVLRQRELEAAKSAPKAETPAAEKPPAKKIAATKTPAKKATAKKAKAETVKS
jgi:large subunit ribosomal protein L29